MYSQIFNAVEVLQIIRQCYFDESLQFLEIRPSAKIDLKDARFVALFQYKRSAGDILGIPEQHVPEEKQDREVFLAIRISSQVDDVYKLSERMTLIDGQVAVRLASRKYQGNDENGNSISSDKVQDESADEVEWNLNDLQDSGR